MLDIGWSELLVVGVVALIVVGPKDLPHLFHSLGRFTARARSMAREFTSAMDDAAKGSGLDEAAGSLREMKSLTSKKALGLDALDRAAERFEKWDPKRPDDRTKAPKDPGTPPKPADAGVTAASASAASTSDTAAQDAPAGTAQASDAGGSGDEHAATPPPDTEGEAGAGKRRLHAVRRSDMKDH